MDATHLEELVATAIKKALSREVSVIIGPTELGKFSGIRPEVFVHVSEFIDFDGQMADGANIARYPAKGPSTYRGFEENRPAMLMLSVSVIDSAYRHLKNIANLLVPTILLALESESELPLGQLKNGSVKLKFNDMQRSLHRYNIDRNIVDGVAILQANFEFKILGFLDVWVTKRGGLRVESKTTMIDEKKTVNAESVKTKSAKPKTKVKAKRQKVAAKTVAKAKRRSVKRARAKTAPKGK